jgi:hypothetical protein
VNELTDDLLCCLVLIGVIAPDLGQQIKCLFHLVLVSQCEKLLHDDSHFFELLPLIFVEFEEVPFETQVVRLMRINYFGEREGRKNLGSQKVMGVVQHEKWRRALQ